MRTKKDRAQQMDEALQFITSYRETEKITPMVREVQRHLGVSSPSAAYLIIRSLQHSGRISVRSRCPRSITVRGRYGSGQKDR